MKPGISPSRGGLVSLILSAGMPFAGSIASAQTSGTWAADAAGNWNAPANWTGGNIASGATATADFSTVNLTANRTVTVDAPFTIGTLTAQDASLASHDWIFDGPGPLTLSNGLAQPVITVTNRTTTLSTPLAGTNGLRKDGAGLLVLSGDNSALSGTLLLDDVAGTNNAGVALDGIAAVGSLSQITINGTAGSGAYLELRNGATVPATTTVNLNSPGGNNFPSGAIRTAGTGVVTIDGPINIGLNSARISNIAAQRLDINGVITGGANGIMFRQASNEGIHLTNTGNSWTGTTTHSGGTLSFAPNALPAANLLLAASDPGTIQTSGSFTRALGTGANQFVFANSASRAQGIGAYGGDLTVNIGGAASALLFDTGTTPPADRIRTNILVLNGPNATHKITLANPLDLNGAARTIQVDANVAELTGGVTGGAFSLTKTGAGILRLGANLTHAGATIIGGGTLELAGADNRLPTTGALNFSASGTLDVAGTNQTVASIDTPNGVNAALSVLGSGSLTVNGAANLQIGPGGTVTSAHAVNLALFQLDEFTYNNPAGTFRVGLKASSGNTGNLGQVATATLAASNTITAATLAVGDIGANNHGGTSTLQLGPANNINANNINIGTSGRSNSNFTFDPFVLTPAATFRGADGTSPVTQWRVGQVANFQAGTWTDIVNLTSGTIDAKVTSLVVGTADIASQTGRGGTENASFIMGNGTLEAGSILLGRIQGTASSSITSTMAANGTLTLDHASGLLKATTITLAENAILGGGAGNRSVSGTLNLNNGTIEAATIRRGAQTGNAIAASGFNWTNGTLRNPAGGDLLIDSVPVTLAFGNHVFDVTGSNSITFNSSSALSGTAGFIKTGTGTLNLNGLNDFDGPTEVQQGTLAISTSFPANADITVNAAATLSLANVNLPVDALTGRALDIEGNLVIAGPVNVLIPDGNPVGTSTILDHGSITGIANLTTNYRNFSFNNTTTETSMTVGDGLALTWSGANGSNWDLKNTVNWKDGGNADQTFYWWDSVTFNETGALVQPTVNLVGELRPAAVTVDSTTDYTFSGTGTLAGPFTLTKNGTGTLNLGGSHTFDGGISILGGTLKPTGNQSLGANGQVITIAAGGTLDLNGAQNADRDYEAVISGTGNGGFGAIVNTGADLTNGIGSLTLAADATIGGPGRWEMRPITPGAAVVDLDGHTLTKTGTSAIAFSDGSMSADGTLNINEGSITMARMDLSGAGNINVNTAATLRFNNQSFGLVSKPIALNDGILELTGSSNFTLDSTVALTGTGTVNVSNGRVLSLTGAVGGTGGLTKGDAGQVILLADNTYSGPTTVSAGTLQFGNLGTTGAPGAGDIVNDATLRFARIGATTVANNISGTGSIILGVAGLQTATEWDAITTLTGTNTFAGSITVNSGGLRILNAAALGTGPKNIVANNGSNGRSQFYLDGTGGDITVPAEFSFRTSTNDAIRPAIGNLAGNNVIEGTVTLTSGGGDTLVKIDAGSLTLNGTVTTSAPSIRFLRLAGASGTSGTINGQLTNGNTTLGVVVQGQNTWTLTNSLSNYTGPTTVNSGTLLINGNLTAANGNVTVNNGGTLGGTGTVGGNLTANTGSTIAPGTSIGTLTTAAPINLAGTLAIEIDDTSSDRLDVGGALDLNGATLAITELAAPTQPAYIIATYSGLSGSFATITGMPAGYGVVYNHNNQNQIAIVQGATTPFGTWIDGFTSITDPDDKLPGADADGDGVTNLVEFALNGDPSSGASNGLIAHLVQDATTPAGDELTLIIAARRGAVFGPGANGTSTASIDGVQYTIEGAGDLALPATAVTHAGASDTAPAATGLPSLVGEDWEYHTFSLDSSEGLPSRGFLRVRID